MPQNKKFQLQTKRIYAPVEKEDGCRILVDRLWPRGIKKEDAHLDQWAKETAPSNEARKAFNHELEKYPAFQKEYMNELDHNPDAQALKNLCLRTLKESNVTLLFGAKDEEHNNAKVLQAWILQKK